MAGRHTGFGRLVTLVMLAWGPVVSARQDLAEHDYTLHCSGCHRADGTGAPDHVPSLVGVDRFLRVPGGRAYLIRAPGVAQAPVGDARLADLMNWVVVRFGTETHDPKYTATEVAAWRAEPLRDPTDVRAALVSQIEAGAKELP